MEQYGSDNDSGSSQEEAAEATVLGAWDQLFSNDDHLIFGARQSTVDLTSLHPEPAQIFKFWQIFLDSKCRSKDAYMKSNLILRRQPSFACGTYSDNASARHRSY
jgi:hypothetical protein